MVWHDLRYALRLMRRNPGFTAVAMFSLALGIGANTAIFSLFDAILLRTLPVSHPEQLVELLQKYPGEPRGGYWSWRSYEHIREQNQVFSALTGTGFDNAMQVRTEVSEPETLICENIRANYFEFLGLKPAIGRLIGPEDAPVNGDGEVVVISWSYWNGRFRSDPAVLGKRLYLKDVPKTIVGVAPRDYTGPRVGSRTDVWLPTAKDTVAILARLKSGVKVEQARAEMEILYRFTIEERAAASKDPLVRQLKVEVEPAAGGFSMVRDRYGKPLILLMAVVGMLLLLACINIASMLLARGAGRQRELAVRVGLGASRWRLMRQMLTESVVLSGMGTLLGCLFAYFGAETLVRIVGSGRLHERIAIEVKPDLSLLLFTAGIAVLTGLLFGLAPAWHAFRMAPGARLKQSGRGGENKGWRIFAKGLVAAQVGLSIVLATGAFVFLNHVSSLRNQDLGFRSDHVLLVQLDPERSGYKREQLVAPYQEMVARMEAISGVRSVSITGCTPIQGCGASRFVTVEGFVERPEDRRFTALSWVAPRYFETLGIPLLAGRDFSFADAGRPRVAMINEAMARYYFPDVNPIGRHVGIDRDSGAPYEIVGVVGDAKATELREVPPRTMYINMFQESRLFHQFVLRTSGDPASLVADVRGVVRPMNIARVTTLSDQVDAAMVPERLIATLSGSFGALGGVLAGIGLYGLLAYTVTRRINEIGVRMTLGATAGSITRMVLGEAVGMVIAGFVIGIPLLVWGRMFVTQLVDGLHLPGIGPIVLGAGTIIAIAVLASSIPARRAARVDPMVALRHD